ncbi:hypothetical protein SH449x_002473 [Pirellulaceae bacterium SH449]
MKSSLRSRLFIDSPVQMMLVGRVLLHWLIFFGLFFLTLLTIEYFLRDPGVTLLDCVSNIRTKHSVVIVLSIALLPVFLYDTIKMSNRFVGPIYRFRKNLKSLAEGKAVEEMNFRNKDFWAELSSDFNQVAKRLNQQTNTSSRS